VARRVPARPQPPSILFQAAAVAGLGLGLLWWFQERLVSSGVGRWGGGAGREAAGRDARAGDASPLSLPKIYIPRIPGVPDEIPFYPDRFGLEYEVRGERMEGGQRSTRARTPRASLTPPSPLQDIWLTAADGVKLHAWLLRAPGPRAPRGPCVIFFQENAGNMAMRLPFLRLLVRNLGCAVLAPR
jgi:hypothetical protein